jgi:SanA protein
MFGWLRRRWMPRRWRKVLVIAVGLAGLTVGLAALRISPSVRGWISESVDATPPHDVGVVLGCSPRVSGGRRNLFFEGRIQAAAQLFHAGKVKHLIVSGDNADRYYDEPTAMKKALIAAGVPAKHITRDFAGFRTLDSVLRARDVFGLSRFVVISQRFHAERAVYLAREHGIEATGFAAADVNGIHAARTRLREIGSRVAAVLDVYVFKTAPKFLGPRLDWRRGDG